MSANTKSKLPVIAFALAALASAVPAAVHAETAPRTEKVFYGDLNLTSEDGIKVLDRRLDRAVRRVCGEDSRLITIGSAVRECVRRTRAAVGSQREFAIARAKGQDGKAWAENTSHGQPTIALAE